MATSFPTAIDSFVNPTATDTLDSVTVPHASQHTNENDALLALQTKVGINGSTDPNSLDYKVAHSGGGVLDAGMLLGATSLGLNYLCPYAVTSGNLSTATLTNGRTFWIPFYVNENITVSTLNIKVSTAQVGGSAKVGIYSINTSSLPDSLLAVSTALDCSTTGIKTYTLGSTILLQAKIRYFMAIFGASTGTAPVLSGVAANYMQSVLHTQDTASVAFNVLIKDSETNLNNPSSTPTQATGAIPIAIMIGASR